MAEYQRVVGLREKLFNANSVVYVLVLIWWIVCLWIDEPGTPSAGKEIQTGEIAVEADGKAGSEFPAEAAE